MDKPPATTGPPAVPKGEAAVAPDLAGPTGARDGPPGFTTPRNFFNNRFVYAVISQRAGGLSLGVDLNPDKHCNFDCLYCEVNRDELPADRSLNLKGLCAELQQMLTLSFQGRLRTVPAFQHTPGELLELKGVALSGNGEPTLSPHFAEVVHEVVRLRSLGRFPFFKLTLITNASGLDLPAVRAGLRAFTAQDEVWAKLDAGTQGYMDRINRPKVSLKKILANILHVARDRPVVIQSLFPLVNGEEPPAEEIEQYVARLRELKAAGAQISLVQVYSAHRPPHRPMCGHLPLKSLSRIAHRVREATGLRAEVF